MKKQNYNFPSLGYNSYAVRQGSIIKNRILSIINDVEESAIKLGTQTVKKHFGKEFTFYNNSSGEIVNGVVTKFIKKYDKHFSKHTQKGAKDLESISDTYFIVKLEEGTFMYVAAGNKIGNVEDRFLINSNISSYDLYIYIFGKKMHKYVNELEKITHDIYCSDDLGLFTVDCASGYSSENGESLDVTYQNLIPRSMNTLFYSDNEKEKVCNHIDKFISNKEFYTEKQLLYKTGILLWGSPGTGKTSLVKAIASKYNRSIAALNVSNLKNIDLNKLTQSINYDENRKYIVLMEDIDTLFLNREDGESNKDDQAIINKLLQFLDSNTSPNDVIFIATTNHKERLDEALLREGRFDIKVEVKPLKDDEAREFCKSFYLDDKQTEDIITNLHKEFPDKQLINQSTLQARILSKIENRSLEKTIEIYGEMEE